MPGTLKVRVLAARDLPVMDRASETADPFVEMKFGQGTYKTEIYPKSLNPQWMSDWFTFEADDEELQDECLQFRVMDYDTYSANDAIGRVYLDLNPLLSKNGPSQIAGWLPIYDPMHGIRGELSVIVKIDLFRDINRFRQSSCGVDVFATPGIPTGYYMTAVHGLVEELLANDDPEYQWIDKIRTPRASNEARQVLFSQMAGQIVRRMGRKVLEMGGNAIIGYRQCFDLEGETGVVARGLGTSVTLEKTSDPCLVGSPGSPEMGRPTSGNIRQHALSEVEELSTSDEGSLQKGSLTKPQKISSQRRTVSAAATSSRESSSSGGAATVISESETITAQPVGHSTAVAVPSGQIAVLTGAGNLPKTTPLVGSDTTTQVPSTAIKPTAFRQPTSGRAIDHLEYPFFTMQIYPIGFIAHLGSIVCARSVKLLSVIETPDEDEIRHSWWQELRNEMRSHMRAMACNSILGYREQASVFKDVCILSAMGTAAVIDPSWWASGAAAIVIADGQQAQASLQNNAQSTSLEKINSASQTPREKMLRIDTILANRYSTSVRTLSSSCEPCIGCTVCHIPYSENSLPFPVKLAACACCGNGSVPSILLTTIDPLAEVGVNGNFTLIQARVVRRKQDSSGETLANELSDMLPFIEHELHSQLVSKLSLAGKNAIFGLRTDISLGENHIVVMATGTAVCLAPLDMTKTSAAVRQQESSSLDADGSQKQQQKVEKPERANSTGVSQATPACSTKLGQGESGPMGPGRVTRPSLDVAWDRDAVWAELAEQSRTQANPASTVSLAELEYPKDFYCCNTCFLPNVTDWNAGDMRQLQLFVRLSQGQTLTTEEFDSKCLSDRINWLIRSTCFKFRKMKPICLASVECDVDFPQDGEYQISLIGMALTANANSPHLVKIFQEQRASGSSQGSMQLAAPSRPRQSSDTPAAGVTSAQTKSTDDKGTWSIPRSGSLTLNIDPADQLSSSCPTSTFQNLQAAGFIRRRRTSTAEETPAVKSRQIFVTPLTSPGHSPIAHYLGHYDFFFVRETTALREAGGLESFTQTALTEVLYVVQSHVAAFGGHGMVAFRFTKIELSHNSSRNQAQCLVGVAGDIVTTMTVAS